ncbi:cupin domain-containing protein [Pseudofrankia asymbiotica]|uniref:Cupin n=1 Tax=Pseudofrankia asymbiotica TaxID=1834516 RepID=A0A1V2I091_9ACTN|nr:cupin domain-containing protein [Pseudofrankia asymbiotica]ONH22399.1 cupin [Pseudofrankia asymbiotica]
MQLTRSGARSVTAPSEWFTGTAWVDEIAAPVVASRVRVDTIHFAPGTRTVWHRHPFGQVLYVTEGTGVVQARGGPVEVLRAGDSVRILPDEWHWHGAYPTTFMTHLAVQEVAEDGTEAERGAPVTDTEYHA